MKTLGQIAYEAKPLVVEIWWKDLPAMERYEWEVAANAVAEELREALSQSAIEHPNEWDFFDADHAILKRMGQE